MNTASVLAQGTGKKPQGPEGYPLFGVIPKLRKNPLNYFVSTALEYGDMARLQMGPRVMYLVSHPDSVRYILQENNKNFIKGYDQAKPLLGEGLVSSDGELWLRQRRLMQPMFGRTHIAELSSAMTEETAQMVERWRRRKEKEFPLDVAEEMMALTQAIIVRTMFGTDLKDIADEVSRAFTTTLEYLNFVLLAPFAFLYQLPTPQNLRNRRALNYLEKVIFDIIHERERNPMERQDLLGLLMGVRDEATGTGMSDQQLRDEIMTIFLAGHETTATALAWSWYLLGKNPEWQRRLQEEVDQVLQGRMPSFDDLPKLMNTRLVFDEALRLYPPAWMFARRVVNDDCIGGFDIPAGAMLMISPYITHRLPQFWENPEGFDPERHTPARSEERPRYAYFPFSGGPRQCIGNNFALTEGVLILAMMVQSFELALAPGKTVEATPVATLRPKPGVWMYLRERN